MVVNGIDTTDISVVVQGPVRDAARQCLAALRQALPGAELILSTWEGTDTDGLDFDRRVFSRDPGSVISDEVAGMENNLDRQIVSTAAGLEAAVRPYILKTRTDILFHGAGFLSYFGRYDGAPSPYFQNRLLICSHYTRNPRISPLCFHPSDWIVFGRAEDVRAYYAGLPLMTPEEGGWFHTHRKERMIYTNFLCRYVPEQHFFIHYLQKHGPLDFDCYYDRTAENVAKTERAVAECFVVLDYQKQLDITFTRYEPNRYLDKHSLLTHWQWRALYGHYCQRGSPALWAGYRLYSALMGLVAALRAGCVLLLDKLGLKETVKRLFHIFRDG